MKKFLSVLMSIILTLGLGASVLAGDVKLGGEMYLNGYYSGDNDAENPDYGGWFKLKLTQDVNDLVSWQVLLNYDYEGDQGVNTTTGVQGTNSWKTDSNNSVKLYDAFVKLKFNPIVSMRLGRFESKYDQGNQFFAGEWDNFKQVVRKDGQTSTAYALTNWKANWRERNTFGAEVTETASDKLNFMETAFCPEDEKDWHFGLKANYSPTSNWLLTGSYYEINDDQKNIFAQATYKINGFSFYGLFDRQNLTDDHNNIYAFGASYTMKNQAVYAERYVETGHTDNTLTKLGYEYYLGKNTALYINYLDPKSYDSVIRTGIYLTF